MTTDGDGRPPPESAASPESAAPPETAAPPQSAPILDQAFDAGSLYALRAAVVAHATQAGLTPGRADNLVIAVHELAANAVRHGAGHGRLRIWRSDQALLCEISDDGLPDAQDAQDAQRKTRKRSPSGAPSPATASPWSARSPITPACAPAATAPRPPSASPSARPARRSAWTGKKWTAAPSWPSPAPST